VVAVVVLPVLLRRGGLLPADTSGRGGGQRGRVSSGRKKPTRQWHCDDVKGEGSVGEREA
jgi:hypothetical protein